MVKRLFITTILITFLGLFPAWAQFEEPVKFESKAERISSSEIILRFFGKIDSGWHVYSTDLGDGGPTAASFHVDKQKGIEPVGKLKAIGKEEEVNDPVFGMTVRYFEKEVVFEQKLKITAEEYEMSGYLEYGACDDKNCIPPSTAEFSLMGSDGLQSAATEPAPSKDVMKSDAVKDSEAPVEEVTDTVATVLAVESTAGEAEASGWWKPVVEELRAYEGGGEQKGLLTILLLGFLGGIIALFTPCVWPIIPMTVSFFLHRSQNRRKALRESILYGASIVVIYVGFGLLLTLWKGANALNALSTDASFNIFFFLLLLVFGASFLGGFEITLPSSWNNKINQKADATTGLISIFLMAFTLVLVSFSCTGPIIGFLLVEVSTYNSILSPALGMFGFALALALPFTLFALFPSWLKKMPKSGGWMNVIKVTLGFIELAFALKFLSVADLAYGWHILDRETFLSIWIVLFALLGCYLLGVIRFPGDDEQRHTSVIRFFPAVCSLAFAVYMIPGLWGAPLKAISAFAPPIYTQDFNLDKTEVKPMFTDFDEGMEYAQKEGKPVLLDFTGFGCVNCRKMEMAVWNKSQVKSVLEKDYVLISLYVDDKTPLPEPVRIQENGKERVLRTVGDRWSHLQRSKFGASAQPFYVAVDNEGMPLGPSYGFKEDIDAYLKFLKTGLENYRRP